jgi:nitroreductase
MPPDAGKAHVAELIRTQRATREYAGQPVSVDDLRTIINAGRRAQSSNNNQPWHFIVVREPEQLQRLSEGGKYATFMPDAAFAIALITPETGAADGFDLGQAAAYLQLSAWDLGIGSCITWMHFPEKAHKTLGLPEDQQCHVVLVFGYPAPRETPQTAKRDGRKPFDEVVHWERWT